MTAVCWCSRAAPRCRGAGRPGARPARAVGSAQPHHLGTGRGGRPGPRAGCGSRLARGVRHPRRSRGDDGRRHPGDHPAPPFHPCAELPATPGRARRRRSRRATPGATTTSPTVAPAPRRTVGPAGDRTGRARRPARQGEGAADRLRPWAVRAGVGGHRPQRLRHPQRHPAPRPDRARAPRRDPRLPRPQRSAGRPLHRAADRVRPWGGHVGAGADRPRGGALRRLAEGRPAVEHVDPHPVRERPAQPAGGRRPDQPGQERR